MSKLFYPRLDFCLQARMADSWPLMEMYSFPNRSSEMTNLIADFEVQSHTLDLLALVSSAGLNLRAMCEASFHSWGSPISIQDPHSKVTLQV